MRPLLLPPCRTTVKAVPNFHSAGSVSEAYGSEFGLRVRGPDKHHHGGSTPAHAEVGAG